MKFLLVYLFVGLLSQVIVAEFLDSTVLQPLPELQGEIHRASGERSNICSHRINVGLFCVADMVQDSQPQVENDELSLRGPWQESTPLKQNPITKGWRRVTGPAARIDISALPPDVWLLKNLGLPPELTSDKSQPSRGCDCKINEFELR